MTYKVKVCLVCGKEYQPTNGRQKYCTECGPTMKAERDRAYAAKWNKANAEKKKTDAIKWNEVHPGYKTIWYEANPEKCRGYYAKYKKTHRENCAVWVSNRRAAKYANTPIGEMLTSTEWLAILAEHNGHCHYCSKKAKLTLDHVIPLSRGGKHSKDNVVPACAHCNYSKGNKTLEEWLAKKQHEAVDVAA